MVKMTDIEWWVREFKETYLPTAAYEGDDSIALCEERAIDSFACELREALQRAEREWWEQPCETCDGEGYTRSWDDVGRQFDEFECIHCRGTGREHQEA